jgi:ABC-type amino acid transport substrate-binding protein
MFPNVMRPARAAVETSVPLRIDSQGHLPMARMRHWHGIAVALLFLALAVVPPVVAAKAATLDDIRARKTVRIGVRADAQPFSFTGPDGAPAGYMVELCKSVVLQLTSQLNIPNLAPNYVVVTGTDRLDAVAKGRVDLLCEATSATLRRRETVDFSIATFVDGAGVVTTGTNLVSLPSLAGQSIAVLAGTTTEEELRNSLKDDGITADLVTVSTHNDGITMLHARKIAAYFAERSILVGLLRRESPDTGLELGDVYLSVEPYALALPRGDEDFRLAVDRALSRIYRSGAMQTLLDQTFGNNSLTKLETTLYELSALPE